MRERTLILLLFLPACAGELEHAPPATDLGGQWAYEGGTLDITQDAAGALTAAHVTSSGTQMLSGVISVDQFYLDDPNTAYLELAGFIADHRTIVLTIATCEQCFERAFVRRTGRIPVEGELTAITGEYLFKIVSTYRLPDDLNAATGDEIRARLVAPPAPDPIVLLLELDQSGNEEFTATYSLDYDSFRGGFATKLGRNVRRQIDFRADPIDVWFGDFQPTAQLVRRSGGAQ